MLKRCITAAVGIPALVLVIKGCTEEFFFLLMLCVVILALREFFTMAFPPGNRGGTWLGVCLGSALLCTIVWDASVFTADPFRPYSLGAACCAAGLAAIFFYHIFTNQSAPHAFNRVMLTVFGIGYIAFLSSYIVLIRSLTDGMNLLLVLLCVTWAGDTGAYIIGTRYGRHALCRTISPRKTWEGACASLACALGASILCRIFLVEYLRMVDCVALGLGINVMNQFGDLCESLMKRAFDAKDSGSVLPGHGGILDRIDSLLFAAPFLFYYMRVFG